ncbi:hypothetical protein QKT49_gp130 [Acanthamoeba castellanii medusavirus]|uniref:Uncharacterized protein n=1 Tax=Acanthamoeba castellanii medusavirus J1 TaxID=3114988 RepID=A0A3T1CWQ6_9VIRU|nr:hypothetical protein QKT49_gp130 [Acanthamoeba castellanii medusavirus]BBI30270.1 hypothetical protein [Acanthamoeba castellanii medusavirus J1]
MEDGCKRRERQRAQGRVCTGHTPQEYYGEETPPEHPTQAKYRLAGVWMCGDCYNANKSFTRVWRKERASRRDKKTCIDQ